ncbi:DUF2147 domain-containing protein [Maribellus comscasis]|uniref:DUF2147 domain-containing protein n=1 Tax=Maribellus comscasis TaxID=2681766 RepID=A0A6I6JX86_9BACT|nr:DUF2147 domain-containing protein [Maribellus comscasis]QGY44787.1 DUF2147 domain-containing protein [Maribellus comscasis]
MENIFFNFNFLVPGFYNFYAQLPDDLLRGVWANENNTAHYKFKQERNNYTAQLVWFASSGDLLQNQLLPGFRIIQGLEFMNDRWESGTFLNPETGVSARCQIEMRGLFRLSLKTVEGNISTTKTWKRIK